MTKLQFSAGSKIGKIMASRWFQVTFTRAQIKRLGNLAAAANRRANKEGNKPVLMTSLQTKRNIIAELTKSRKEMLSYING